MKMNMILICMKMCLIRSTNIYLPLRHIWLYRPQRKMSSTFLTFFNIFLKIFTIGVFSYIVFVIEIALLNDLDLFNPKKVLTYYFTTYIIMVLIYFICFNKKKTWHYSCNIVWWIHYFKEQNNDWER